METIENKIGESLYHQIWNSYAKRKSGLESMKKRIYEDAKWIPKGMSTTYYEKRPESEIEKFAKEHLEDYLGCLQSDLKMVCGWLEDKNRPESLRLNDADIEYFRTELGMNYLGKAEIIRHHRANNCWADTCDKEDVHSTKFPGIVYICKEDIYYRECRLLTGKSAEAYLAASKSDGEWRDFPNNEKDGDKPLKAEIRVIK